MCIRDRDHLGLDAFANYINEKLGDKYRVEVYPSELLGSQTEMVQLTDVYKRQVLRYQARAASSFTGIST